jgi:hypothetical protein
MSPGSIFKAKNILEHSKNMAYTLIIFFVRKVLYLLLGREIRGLFLSQIVAAGSAPRPLLHVQPELQPSLFYRIRAIQYRE